MKLYQIRSSYLRSVLSVGAALSLLLANACSKTDATPPAASAAPASPSAATPPAEGPLGSTLSEEAFKALHQLKGEKAPPLHGQMIEIKGTDAYLSLPKGKQAPMPGVVVIQEWWGLNEHIKHWADRLAEDGYAAVAVDLYGGKVATTPDQAMEMMKAVDKKKALEIVLAGHDFLEQDARIKAPKTGSIGWCFGGGWSLQLALHAPDLDAAVIYYGHLVTDPAELRAIKAPILGIFANRDKAITPEQVNEFDKALTTAGVEHTILRYDADHAFANPSGPRYNEAAAKDAWAKAQAFLAAKLKTP